MLIFSSCTACTGGGGRDFCKAIEIRGEPGSDISDEQCEKLSEIASGINTERHMQSSAHNQNTPGQESPELPELHPL